MTQFWVNQRVITQESALYTGGVASIEGGAEAGRYLCEVGDVNNVGIKYFAAALPRRRPCDVGSGPNPSREESCCESTASTSVQRLRAYNLLY